MLFHKGMKSAESKEIYEKTSQTVENLSERIIGTMRVSYYLVLWPYFFISYIKYFTTDLGADAFELPSALR